MFNCEHNHIFMPKLVEHKQTAKRIIGGFGRFAQIIVTDKTLPPSRSDCSVRAEVFLFTLLYYCILYDYLLYYKIHGEISELFFAGEL